MHSLLDIKREIYNIYDKDISKIAQISAEISYKIPSTKPYSIIKDHKGISLSFLCDLPDISKYDIDSIVRSILINIVSEYLDINEDDLNLIYNSTDLFIITYCRGFSFSIII